MIRWQERMVTEAMAKGRGLASTHSLEELTQLLRDHTPMEQRPGSAQTLVPWWLIHALRYKLADLRTGGS